jgi:hypothetical protein
MTRAPRHPDAQLDSSCYIYLDVEILSVNGRAGIPASIDATGLRLALLAGGPAGGEN